MSSKLNVAREDLGEETIAENLGLSPEEVAKWMVRQELDQSEEGVLFGHRIVFADDTPKSILEKAGAEEGELYVIISDLYV